MEVYVRAYRGHVLFTDGREFDDLWVDEESGLSYYERIGKNDVLRAEFGVYHNSDGRVTLDEYECLYEYDADGLYYYNECKLTGDQRVAIHNQRQDLIAKYKQRLRFS